MVWWTPVESWWGCLARPVAPRPASTLSQTVIRKARRKASLKWRSQIRLPCVATMLFAQCAVCGCGEDQYFLTSAGKRTFRCTYATRSEEHTSELQSLRHLV